MTKPYTLYEQQGHNWFKPKHRLAFIFGMSKFDACWRRDKQGNLVKAFNDLDNAKTDCITLIDCLKKYEILEEDIIDCSDNPTCKKVDEELTKLSQRLRHGKNSQPVENYLIIFLYAGYGILRGGMQCLVYNEYDEKKQFYKLLMAEAKMRGWAEIYPNLYIIGIFSCCRQLYDQPTMSGFYSKEDAEKYNVYEKTVGLAPLHVTHFNKELLRFQMAHEEFQKQIKVFKDEQVKYPQKSLESKIQKTIQARLKSLPLVKPVLSTQLKPEASKPSKRINTQKFGYCAEQIAQNLCLLFGTRPSHSVTANTSMVKDITKMMTSQFSNETLSLKVPDCFEYLTTKDGDTKFETVTSNQLQPLNMIFSHNIVTKTVAYIFTFDECKGCKVNNFKERGNKAIELFQGVFEFQEVSLFHNLPKDQVIKKLEDLKKQANIFEISIENQKKGKAKALKALPDQVKKIWRQLGMKDEETMDFETAFKCTNLTAKENTILNEQTKSKFTDDFARLDFDGDDDVTLTEMIRYEQARLQYQQLFLAGICWIGRNFGDSESAFNNQEFKDILKSKVKRQETLAESKDKFYPWFELTNLGQPICLNEYATDIASGPNSHVLHLDDFDPENEQLKEDNISADGDFQEKLLTQCRKGRKRHTFITECNIETMQVLFNTQKENSQVFVIPHHIQETNMALHIWPNVGHREQIFLDLRTEIDKANVRLSRFVNTFRKTHCNVWQDQPKIVNYEQCYEKRWQPSVHNITNQEQIVQITGDVDDPTKITLIFYSYITYIEKSRVCLEMENFTSAMIVNENRSKVPSKSGSNVDYGLGGQLGQVLDYHINKELLGAFFVVLFTQNKSPQSCRLYKIYHQPLTEQRNKKEPHASKWHFKRAEAVSNPQKSQSGFMNAFRIRSKEVDQILLVTCFRFLIYDEELKLIHAGNHTEFEPQSKLLRSFNQGMSGYLLGFDLPSKTAYEKKIKSSHVYRNERNYEGENSWIVRCTLDEDNFKFECSYIDKRKKSLLLKDEVIYTVLEYALEKMIVSLKLTNLLIVHKWMPLKMISRNSQGNIQKYYFDLLPNFDEQKFPFIACSGFEHISLVNVRDLQMQIFVQVPCRSVKSQQAFFFKEEKYGSSLHFCSKEIQEGGKELHKWYQLELKKDFDKQLRQYARLPVNLLQSKQLIANEIQQYRVMKEELFPDHAKSYEPITETKKLNTPNTKTFEVNELKNKLALALNPDQVKSKHASIGSHFLKLHSETSMFAEERKRDTEETLAKLSLQHDITEHERRNEIVKASLPLDNHSSVPITNKIVQLEDVDEPDSLPTSSLQSNQPSANRSQEVIQEVHEEVESLNPPVYESEKSRASAHQQEETQSDHQIHGSKHYKHSAPQVNATNVYKRNNQQFSKIEEMLSQHDQMMTKLVDEQQQLKEQASKQLHTKPVTKPIKAKNPVISLLNIDTSATKAKNPLQIEVQRPEKKLNQTNQFFTGFSTPQRSRGQRPQSAKNTKSLASKKEINMVYTKKSRTPAHKFHQLSTNSVKKRPSSQVQSPTNKKGSKLNINNSTMFSPRLTSPLNMTPSSQSKKKYTFSSYYYHPFEQIEKEQQLRKA